MGRGGVVDADTRTEAVTRESVGPSGAIPPTTHPTCRRESPGKVDRAVKGSSDIARSLEWRQISPSPPSLRAGLSLLTRVTAQGNNSASTQSMAVLSDSLSRYPIATRHAAEDLARGVCRGARRGQAPRFRE